MTINLVKLEAELQASKILGNLPDYAGVNDQGIIRWNGSPTQNELNTASAIVAAHNGNIPLGQVDATTTGAKLVGIVGGDGLAFLGKDYFFAAARVVGKTVDPQGSLGTNSPLYNNIQAATTLTGWAGGDFMRFTWAIGARKSAILTPTPVYVNIIVAAVATTYVIAAEFNGDYRSLPT